jgi:hypothetical protein
VTKTEFPNGIMLFTKKEFEEHDYRVYSKSLSGDAKRLSEGDCIQDLDRLIPGQCLGIYHGLFNAKIEYNSYN